MYVRNHDVPSSALSRLVEQAKLFFALPTDEKSVAVENSPQFRGYLPLEYTGNEGDQWPSALPSLRAAMWDYFVAMGVPDAADARNCAGTRARARFLRQFPSRPDELKLNHYPPQEIMDETEIIGVGGHCDGGSFTILWQDSLGGLEVRNKSGDWVGVPPIDGTFVINIANLLQRWTNGLFHRPNTVSSTAMARIATRLRSSSIRPIGPSSARWSISRAASSSRSSAARTC